MLDVSGPDSQITRILGLGWQKCVVVVWRRGESRVVRRKGVRQWVIRSLSWLSVAVSFVDGGVEGLLVVLRNTTSSRQSSCRRAATAGFVVDRSVMLAMNGFRRPFESGQAFWRMVAALVKTESDGAPR